MAQAANLYKLLQYLACIYLLAINVSCSNNATSPPPKKANVAKPAFVTHTLDNAKEQLAIYWLDDANKPIGSLGNLETYTSRRNKKLVFAMNAGMYLQDQSPQGLCIIEGKQMRPLNTDIGYGNFYLKPNGVFYLTKQGRAFVVASKQFKPSDSISYATQSGPMLVIDSVIHPKFNKGGQSKYIRNGVGILPNGKVLLAMSTSELNLYDFASFFLEKGCKNALYLDGYVSRCYAPLQGFVQRDGAFGAIIGITVPAQ